MKKYVFEKTGLEVSPLCFGTWQLGGFPFFKDFDREKAQKLLNDILDLGINFIDTAPLYGFGLSEEILGEVISSRRQDVVISTKCGLKWGKKSLSDVHKCAQRDFIFQDCERSLKRLKTDFIDIYLLHWPDPEVPLKESLEALQSLKERGYINYLGVSNFSLDQLKEATNYAEIFCLQGRLSRLRQEVTPEIRNFCMERNIAIQAYSPLERGLLTNRKVENLKAKNEAAINWAIKNAPEGYEKNIHAWEKEAENDSLSFAQASLKWVFDLEGVSSLIVGSTSLNNIKECMGPFLQ
ncbi:hypothetical protein AB834_02935 [PVC group bacterium (ex Bugula neritina AB1)]|nr:hypothetical protein AB834_02935 [PVC group bacterium (ex Bugula neritina AB1)]